MTEVIKINCPCCKISVNVFNWEKHVSGNKHLTKLDGKELGPIHTHIEIRTGEKIFCKDCNKEFSETYYQRHILSESHKRNKELCEKLGLESISRRVIERKKCDICFKDYAKYSYDQHCKTHFHQKALLNNQD